MFKSLLIIAAMFFTVSCAKADPFTDFFNQLSTPQQTHVKQGHANLGAGRPSGCPSRWCGCWLRLQKGLPKEYDLARRWAGAGSAASKGCVGCVAVMRSHVGIVQGYDARGNVSVLSGNHGHRVGVGTYSAGKIIAYRHV
jgi:hypothetical protein